MIISSPYFYEIYNFKVTPQKKSALKADLQRLKAKHNAEGIVYMYFETYNYPTNLTANRWTQV